MSASVADRVRVQRSAATAEIARRMRLMPVWQGTPYEACLAVAKRLLAARLRLNRAGLLRWRREDRSDARR